jgi:O-6-methylguanine DNA methyltransferase
MGGGVAVREIDYQVDGWGTGLLWFDDELLVWHELPRRIDPPRVAPHPGWGLRPPATRDERTQKTVTGVKRDRTGSVTVAPRIVGRLEAYFAGRPVTFDDVELDLDWCTPFQRAVADTLRAVPYGEVVSYGELAALAGYPNAQRAAGTFCAHNRMPLLIPCHRVVSADGVGSYGSLGVAFKRRLLALEGVSL